MEYLLIKYSVSDCQFNVLSKFARSLLVLSHGNSDPKSGFSQNKLIVSDLRCLLSQKSVVGLRAVKDAINVVGGNTLNVPIMTGISQQFVVGRKHIRLVVL